MQEPAQDEDPGLGRIDLAPPAPVREADKGRPPSVPGAVADAAQGGRPTQRHRPVLVAPRPALIRGGRPTADALLQPRLQLGPAHRLGPDHVSDRFDDSIELLRVDAGLGEALLFRRKAKAVGRHPYRHLRGGEQVQRPSQPDGLDQRPFFPERLTNIAARDFAKADAKHQLRAGGDLRVNTADVRRHIDHPGCVGRAQKVMPLQAPADDLLPGEIRRRGWASYFSAGSLNARSTSELTSRNVSRNAEPKERAARLVVARTSGSRVATSSELKNCS